MLFDRSLLGMSSLRFGLMAGFIVSFAVTVIISIWEWLENPGGIFRSDSGTNWQHVLETAISWFVPTFLNVAVFAGLVHLGWSLYRRRREARKLQTGKSPRT